MPRLPVQAAVGERPAIPPRWTGLRAYSPNWDCPFASDLGQGGRGIGETAPLAIVAVAGHAALETTLRVDGFPIPYTPGRFPTHGVRSSVSGVGFNVAAALAALGHEVRLATILGRDAAGALVSSALAERGIARDWVLDDAPATGQSVVLVDPDGQRQVNTDLKDLRQRVYPPDRFRAALAGADLAFVTTMNYGAPLLAVARAAGIPIATDVHALSDLDDPYNARFMAAADLLFLSGERLPMPATDAARAILERHRPRLVVVGLGADGALLATADGGIAHVPAAPAPLVANTGGAGDALAAAFAHGWLTTGDPRAALERAVVFAAHKIGAPGGGEGFLSAAALEAAFAAYRAAGDRATVRDRDQTTGRQSIANG